MKTLTVLVVGLTAFASSLIAGENIQLEHRGEILSEFIRTYYENRDGISKNIGFGYYLNKDSGKIDSIVKWMICRFKENPTEVYKLSVQDIPDGKTYFYGVFGNEIPELESKSDEEIKCPHGKVL